MELIEEHTQKLLEKMERSALSFSLYRLPFQEKCHLVAQKSQEIEYLKDISSLNNKKGFIIAPFFLSKSHPLILIHPDIVACSWEEIDSKLSKIDFLEDDLLSSPYDLEDVPLISEKEEKQQYTKAFSKFFHQVKQKELQKIVLSRSHTISLRGNLSPIKAFLNACNNYPRMFIYLFHTPFSGTWIGSTPEILLSGKGDTWQTIALAGTMPLEDENSIKKWSLKNQKEQELVVDYLRKITENFGRNITEKGPYTARAGHLLHLRTDINFKIDKTDKLGDLLSFLHPSPAVCGIPKDKALNFIIENEGYNRAYYSGFIGWIDPQGQTNIFVNLRSMKIRDKKATLYAGGGIISASSLEEEWQETFDKMQTMQRIINETLL